MLAVAEGGFASAGNERVAWELGVEKVALPRGGRSAPSKKGSPPRQRWFRQALRWRTGCEGRISVLKRCHGLRRCRYKGDAGMRRWVGLGTVASNCTSCCERLGSRFEARGQHPSAARFPHVGRKGHAPTSVTIPAGVELAMSDPVIDHGLGDPEAGGHVGDRHLAWSEP